MTEDSSCDPGSEHKREQKPNGDLDARLYHLIYGLGISLAFAVADFAFLYPENHAFALLFLAIILSLLAIYEMAVVYRIGWHWVFVVMGAISLTAFIIFVFAPPILPPETETHGWLVAAGEPTPPNSCDRYMTLPPDGLMALLGPGGVVRRQSGKLLVLKVGSCNSVTLERGPDGLLVNAENYDANGNLIYRIERNEFHLVSGEYSYPERPDRSTLVVYDRKGKEMLFVRYLNKTTARVRGTFACSDYQPVTITDNAMYPGGNVFGGCMEGGGIAVTGPGVRH